MLTDCFQVGDKKIRLHNLENLNCRAVTTTSASELALRARAKVGRCPFMPRKLAAASELQIVWAESSNEPVYNACAAPLTG